MQTLAISLTLILSCCWSTLSQTANTPPPIPTIEFCDLLRKAADYENKLVRVRAVYFSAFQVSSFGNPSGSSCDAKSTVWVEFDESVNSSSKPEIAKRLPDSFYRVGFENGNFTGMGLRWETEMVVTGLIYKPNGRGYGPKNIYSHHFMVSTVEELGSVKKTDPPKAKEP